MPKWGYSVGWVDPERTAKASLREARISPKHAREICRAIKGMMLEDAKKFLEDVIALKRPVPFRRYNKKVPHRRGLRGWPTGRFPVKAAKCILRLLKDAEANAEFKGLNTEKLKIIHAAAYPGMKIKKYFPRAYGRSTPNFETLTHVEVVVEEVE
ncbi:MAG TPA: 50S ribosomal protein L22 [Candidatus Bathyarchaeota archaeon]|nr:50S ribosomal protein L22 [Candidatus Bathyarchaeota archaeon]